MEKPSKGLISKALQRCRLIAGRSIREMSSPVGWVWVRVGPEKERFLIRPERMNHPLFRGLLNDAVAEYGYATKGSLQLPCSVELFTTVLWEMDQDAADEAASASPAFCGFVVSSMRRPRRARLQGYRLIRSAPLVPT